jgi:hypothetical protein
MGESEGEDLITEATEEERRVHGEFKRKRAA